MTYVDGIVPQSTDVLMRFKGQAQRLYANAIGQWC
jgi:hypothetical protein